MKIEAITLKKIRNPLKVTTKKKTEKKLFMLVFQKMRVKLLLCNMNQYLSRTLGLYENNAVGHCLRSLNSGVILENIVPQGTDLMDSFCLNDS